MIATSAAHAVPVTAYHHEMKIAGRFGSSVASATLPVADYPFPALPGGSFEGRFVYDSFARLDDSFEGRFPYVSADITLRNGDGSVAGTISSPASTLFVTPTALQLAFGETAGRPFALADLRLMRNGSFSRALPPPPPELPDGWADLNIWTVPPAPAEIAAGSLWSGFLETDGPRAFTGWQVPVASADVSHIGSTPYVREVPEAGSSLPLLLLPLVGLWLLRLATRRRAPARALAADA